MHHLNHLSGNEKNRETIRIDEQTLPLIFYKFFPKLVFYANEYISDEEKARDAVTAVFLDIWEKRSRLEFMNESLLRGFLYSVTKNKTIDLIRKDQQERVVLRNLKYLKSQGDPGAVDNSIILTEAIAIIEIAIRDLRPNTRAVIELLLAGKTYEEVALELNMTMESVRVTKSRAIAALQRKVKDQVIFIIIVMLLGEPGVNAPHSSIPSPRLPAMYNLARTTARAN